MPAKSMNGADLRGSDGFTVIEMLIVSVVFTLVVGGALTATVRGLQSYNTMQEAFEREKSIGDFVNGISYKPHTGVIGVLQRKLADIGATGSTLTLKPIGSPASPQVVYSLSGTELKKKVGSGTAVTVLKNIDTTAGGVTFSVGSEAGNAHRWIKLTAYMKGRQAPYVVYLALRNEGDLL